MLRVCLKFVRILLNTKSAHTGIEGGRPWPWVYTLASNSVSIYKFPDHPNQTKFIPKNSFICLY